MDQPVLKPGKSRRLPGKCCALLLAAMLLPAAATAQARKPAPEPDWPELLLDGGRKLSFRNTLRSERDIRGKRRFWSKVLDVVAGEPDFRPMVRPYGVAVDSRGRVIVTDPGVAGVHIFDIANQKYKLLDRWENSKDRMTEPQGVAVDAQDNIYVTDSVAGKVFVFDAGGKTRRVFGSLKGNEGFFKRPTGIAIDRASGQVYVTDTLRDCVFILDREGRVLKRFGQRGSGPGEFNLPTEIVLSGGTLAVVDSMNFRVQLFDAAGNPQGSIGGAENPSQMLFRAKGLAVDSEGHFYIVDAQWGLVQVFDRQGQLLYRFGNGTGFGNFLLPAGLFIDADDRVYLADSYQARVQVFQYTGLNQIAAGGGR